MFILLFETSLLANSNISYSQEEAKDYYFKLSDFKEPKIYLYENTTYPELGQYWKISSSPDSNLLITEAHLLDFTQFEIFKECYDSTGSKVVEYIMIEGLDSIRTEILESDVYRWNSKEEYGYGIKQLRIGIWRGYDKTRKMKSTTSMEIMGEQLEVLRFEDRYTYKFGFAMYVMQQSFYSKEYGLVRFLRFDESTKENQTYVLTKVYSEDEWLELQE
jgi:hypothetical protein